MSGCVTPIFPGDARGQAQVDALLEAEGIRRDGNLDYTCGLFDEEGALCATGSCFGPTLRCLAVSSEHQGEGLLNQVVTHLAEYQASRGNTHLFLYTKPAAARFFGDLGFYPIGRVPGKLVFLENRRTGFRDYLAALEKTARPGVSAAIVMNANPFTRGHQYLVERAAAENDTVHLFVLSEEAGPIPFCLRKRLVAEGTAHLPNVVLHDSGPYIISSATFPSYFLKDGDTVIRAQAALDLAVFCQIAGSLGVTRRYVGQEKASHVTALYNEIMKESLPARGIECRELPRLEEKGRAVSASTVRQVIHDGRLEEIRDLVPECTYRYFTSPEAESVREALRGAENVVHY